MFINYLTGFFVFLFGLCIGSFLNCVIYRLEQKQKITGRSFCPHCKTHLSWEDLFPVFSFLYLSGKCRYCRKKISLQYLIVETATGIIFLIVFLFQAPSLNFQGLINLIFLFYTASVLITLFVYDLKYYIIPDKVLLPAICVTFILRIFLNFSSFPGFISATLVSAGFFLLIFLVSKGRWMGFGDVKLAVLMGLLLGWPNVLVALFLAFFFGAIIGTIMMIFKGKNLKSEMPFAPFLIAGTFIALFWGQQIVQLYVRLFLNT